MCVGGVWVCGGYVCGRGECEDVCVGEGNVRMCVCGEGGDTLIPDTQKLRSQELENKVI